MICVQTPSLDTQEVDTSFLNKVFESIQGRFNKDSVICIKSTIHPEALANVIKSTTFSSKYTIIVRFEENYVKDQCNEFQCTENAVVLNQVSLDANMKQMK